MPVLTRLTALILWPGRQVLRRFPGLTGAEARLVHNITNYVFWLTLICGGLIWLLLATMPAPR